MATLIPTYDSCARRMTSGERRFAQRLESLLESDYLCWYDVPVGTKYQHPDFVLLHPRRGLLVLEVKDWKRDVSSAAHGYQILLSVRGGRHARLSRSTEITRPVVASTMSPCPASVMSRYART